MEVARYTPDMMFQSQQSWLIRQSPQMSKLNDEFVIA